MKRQFSYRVVVKFYINDVANIKSLRVRASDPERAELAARIHVQKALSMMGVVDFFENISAVSCELV